MRREQTVEKNYMLQLLKRSIKAEISYDTGSHPNWIKDAD